MGPTYRNNPYIFQTSNTHGWVQPAIMIFCSICAFQVPPWARRGKCSMRLDPLGLKECSSWTDGGWFEKPGHPAFDGCWIHTPLNGCCLPEFEFLENHDKIKGEPAPVLYVGSGFDCHIRLPGTFPSRICRFMKHNSSWFLEALLPKYQIHLQGASLEVGQQEPLKDGDIINLHPPADDAVYVIHLDFAGSPKSGEDYPNKYPARFPCRLEPRETSWCKTVAFPE